MENITTERLIEIEMEREQTMADKKFQQWMKNLNVSRMHVDKSAVIRANELMSQYDLSRYRYVINL